MYIVQEMLSANKQYNRVLLPMCLRWLVIITNFVFPIENMMILQCGRTVAVYSPYFFVSVAFEMASTIPIDTHRMC